MIATLLICVTALCAPLVGYLVERRWAVGLLGKQDRSAVVDYYVTAYRVLVVFGLSVLLKMAFPGAEGFGKIAFVILGITIILLTCLIVWGAVLGTKLIINGRRARADLGRFNRCTKCGYDLTGNVSGRCPECGEPA